jgi:hypothetical protein
MRSFEDNFMTPGEIFHQLESITDAEDFAAKSTDVVNYWESSSIGFEAVEPILQFMEKHPSIEFGAPGALVHFVEKFYRKGYEEKLLESISRKPIQHTVWMLNRLINGTKDADEKLRLVRVMEQAKQTILLDSK